MASATAAARLESTVPCLGSDFHCLAPGEGARMCEEFTTWALTQPDLLPAFAAPPKKPGNMHVTAASPGHRRYTACATPTFTSVFTVAELSTMSLSVSQSKSLETWEPFNPLGLFTCDDDVVVDNIEFH